MTQQFTLERCSQRTIKVIGLEDIEAITIGYTGQGNAFKGVEIDNVIIPVLVAAPAMLEALRAIRDATTENSNPRSVAYIARAIIQQIEASE